MKSICSILCLLFLLSGNLTYSQGYWTAKANYTGIALGQAQFQTFSINNSCYIIPNGASSASGIAMYGYDALSNSWSQKADVPEANYPQPIGQKARLGGSAFSVGSKGYVGCGFTDQFNLSQDFYEYNPGTNVWTMKTNFGGGLRANTSGAGNNTDGFLGMGHAASGTLSDWYQYNPGSNSWTVKASLAAATGQVVDRLGSFSYNNKIYVMVVKNAASITELWEYDPTGNNWTMRFTLNSGPVKFYFTISGKAIMNVGNAAGWSAFDLTAFTWKHGIIPPATDQAGFTINGRGFVLGIANDFYEYIPLDILPGTVPAILCGGSQRNLTYTVSGVINAGNLFNVELSDASGSFATPTIIGSISSTVSGTVNYAIPQNTTPGTGYRIRVASTSPAMSGFDNGSNISINIPPATPEICMVTVDQPSDYNIVYWNKTLYGGVDSFIVHREVTTNTYKRIGAIAFTDSSAYIDTARSIGPANGDPNITSYRYKLQIKDTCGNVGALSPYHTSIYFNDLLNGSFIWNTYLIEGQGSTPITYFELMRDDISNGNFLLIGAAAGTANSLNDPSYNTYKTTAVWRVQGNGLNCTYALKNTGGGSPQAQINKSKSNVRNNFLVTGVNQTSKNINVFIAPNPVKEEFTIQFTNNQHFKTEFEITDILGKIILKTESSGTDTISVRLTDVSSGVYFLKIKQGDCQSIKKLVKE